MGDRVGASVIVGANVGSSESTGERVGATVGWTDSSTPLA